MHETPYSYMQKSLHIISNRNIQYEQHKCAQNATYRRAVDRLCESSAEAAHAEIWPVRFPIRTLRRRYSSPAPPIGIRMLRVTSPSHRAELPLMFPTSWQHYPTMRRSRKTTSGERKRAGGRWPKWMGFS